MAIPTDCESCHNTGIIAIGDCEDGIQDACPECGGTGWIDDDVDIFDPQRDMLQPWE